jgi:hypothetical protein
VIVGAALIAELAAVGAGLPDQRTGARRDGDYSMADIGLSALSRFFMGSASFLAHQRALAHGQGRSNRGLADLRPVYLGDDLFAGQPIAAAIQRDGGNLEPNFGHGKQSLASVFLTLNLLAFACHTAAHLAVFAWRAAVTACGATCRFFEHLRTITADVVSEHWPHLLHSIAAAAVRPP